MSKKPSLSVPEDTMSQAFMAALLAASRGDDALAGEILRDIADQITVKFKPKGSVKVAGQG